MIGIGADDMGINCAMLFSAPVSGNSIRFSLLNSFQAGSRRSLYQNGNRRVVVKRKHRLPDTIQISLKQRLCRGSGAEEPIRNFTLPQRINVVRKALLRAMRYGPDDDVWIVRKCDRLHGGGRVFCQPVQPPLNFASAIFLRNRSCQQLKRISQLVKGIPHGKGTILADAGFYRDYHTLSGHPALPGIKLSCHVSFVNRLFVFWLYGLSDRRM